MGILDSIRRWHRKRTYIPGTILCRFIACDIRREIMVTSVIDLEAGLIRGRVRTNNVLYMSKKLAKPQDYGPDQELDIRTMWDWTGQNWGGLPDGSSIVDHSPASDAGRKEAQKSGAKETSGTDDI